MGMTRPLESFGQRPNVWLKGLDALFFSGYFIFASFLFLFFYVISPSIPTWLEATQPWLVGVPRAAPPLPDLGDAARHERGESGPCF